MTSGNAQYKTTYVQMILQVQVIFPRNFSFPVTFLPDMQNIGDLECTLP